MNAAGARSADPAAPVLVLDGGSSSLHLTLFGEHGEALARRDTGEPPGPGAAGELACFLADLEVRPGAVGHRFVHGGPALLRHSLVDDRVRSRLDQAAGLAPLHVPPALALLDAARRLMPSTPHVACFDTVFHADMPEAARSYAVPEKWRREWGLRRYGFHGLSYAWAADRAAEALARTGTTERAAAARLVIAHLGGGCSACAVRHGRGLDTTMGMTPLEGLVMSRRSGSVDPGALLWLQRNHGLDADDLADALQHGSGFFALSGGLSDDTRDLVRAREAGDERATSALAAFTHSCRRGIAVVAASLDRLDALVFTGEIGEDQPEVREEICGGLPVLGVRGGLSVPPPGALDGRDAVVVSAPDAEVTVLVVPTGETEQIAAETRKVLMAGSGA